MVLGIRAWGLGSKLKAYVWAAGFRVTLLRKKEVSRDRPPRR